MKFNFKNLIPYVAALVVFVGVTMLFFSPQLEGKILQQGDIIANKGMAKEATDYYKKTGEVALWTNSMFGGMPTYQISSPQKNNLIKKIGRLFRLGFSLPIGVFLLGLLSFFIAMLLLGVNPWLSMIGSLFFAFSTVHMVYFEAGHNTKVLTIMASAPVIAGMISVLRGRYWIGGAVFTFFLALALSSNHLQMVYYLAIVCGIYMLIMLVQNIKAGTLAHFGKSTAILAIGALLALGTFSSKFLVSKDYAKSTMRGKPILEQKGTEAKSSSETEGLEWSYAMQYSNGLLDVIGGFIPRAAGGSSSEMIGKDSNFAKAVKSRKATAAPLYFGGLPPTAGVLYFGALVFFLFVLGCFLVEGPVKWWLLAGVALTLLISMGKYASFINRPLFEILPYFNKFRAHNSVLEITALLVPILATLGLHKVFTTKDKSTLIKPLLYSVGIIGGFSVLFALLGSSVVSLEGPSDGSYAQYPGIVDALMEDRASYMRSSAFRTLMFVLVGAGAIYAFVKDWISKYIMIAIIGLAGLWDVATVNGRYLSSDDFISERKYKAAFAPRQVDTQILKDTDPHYRVHDLTVNTWNSASGAYYHKLIGGYNAAKLQRIQDVIDRYLGGNNQQVFNMLNTKYFIVPGNNKQPAVQRNTAALGNAWYVSNIKSVATANEEIDALADLDPQVTAIVHKEYSNYISGLSPSKEGNISLTSYSPNKMVYNATGSGDHLAVFSEIWYGPDKGWQAYVDGNSVDHIRVNYLLRGLKIPAGSHEVIFEFNPSLYRAGETISLVSSILILLLCGYVVYSEILKKRNA